MKSLLGRHESHTVTRNVVDDSTCIEMDQIKPSNAEVFRMEKKVDIVYQFNPSPIHYAPSYFHSNMHDEAPKQNTLNQVNW